MGGKEGSRGYLYQAMASVLNSVVDMDWKFVQIEPDTTNDKVDIKWHLQDDTEEVTQVKSSINNFTEAAMKRWLKALIDDAPNANKYVLFLIGTCDDSTKRFINKINKKTFTDDELKELDWLVDKYHKITVQLENFELAALESKINTNLHKFLTIKGLTANYFLLEMMTGAIVFALLKFSTNGEKVSKEEFEKKLLEWVNYNYPEVKTDGQANSKLSVRYYVSNYVSFTDTFKGVHLKLINHSIISNLKKNLEDMITEIDNIRLPSYQREQIEPQKTDQLSKLLNKFQLYTYCEYSDKQKEKIKSLVNKLLGVILSDEFFYVGDLKKQNVIHVHPLLSGTPELIGEDIEKEKHNKLESLEDILFELDSCLNVFSFIESFYVIPLVLHNQGKIHDEKIKVIIRLPKECEILTPDRMIVPAANVIKKFTGYKSYLAAFLRHRNDGKVAENVNHLFKPTNISSPLDYLEDQIEQWENNFKWYVRTLFNFKVHNETDYTVLEYHFDELNPNSSISFPSYLFVKANQNFSITYEITSKNLSEVATGQLDYVIE